MTVDDTDDEVVQVTVTRDKALDRRGERLDGIKVSRGRCHLKQRKVCRGGDIDQPVEFIAHLDFDAHSA